jgi:succinate dehydrogenase / fumarate reductase flavoprotein subunit
MHGSNRLGGNSLSDLLVFGRRAGTGAAEYLRTLDARPQVTEADVAGATKRAVACFDPGPDGSTPENPYTVHTELQQTMNDLVGIIRREDEIEQALKRLTTLRERAENSGVEGHRQFNPGWHLALDLRNMLTVSECVAKAALIRTESRGGHTRDDYPKMDPNWRRKLLVCALEGDNVDVTVQDQIPMRPDLLALFDRSELEKYFSEEELEELA